MVSDELFGLAFTGVSSAAIEVVAITAGHYFEERAG